MTSTEFKPTLFPSSVASRYAASRILITGVTGFIGAHLADALQAAGAQVDGVARRQPIPGFNDASPVRIADLTDLTACRALIKETQPDHIFHLASHVTGRQDIPSVLETFQGNLLAAVNLFTAVSETARPRSIVVAGSSEEPRHFAIDDLATAPYSPYAAAKLGQSAYAAFFRSTMGLPISHARIFMGYGPRQLDLRKLIPYVILSLLRGETPVLSSGRRLADFTEVSDIVAGLLALGLRPDLASADIGTGQLHSVAEVATKLRDMIDPMAQLAFGAAPDRINETKLKADVAKSYKDLNWRPVVELQTGLRHTVDWYRAEQGRLQDTVLR